MVQDLGFRVLGSEFRRTHHDDEGAIVVRFHGRDLANRRELEPVRVSKQRVTSRHLPVIDSGLVGSGRGTTRAGVVCSV